MDELSLIPRGALLLGQLQATPEMAADLCPARHRCRGDGAAAAHHPRAEHGHPVLPGEPRGLSRGDRGGGRLRPRLPDADDRGRHDLGRQCLRHGRRRRRAAGHRHGPPARRRVSATDVRPAAKEEIKSLGASYVGYEEEESKQAQTAGGYAKQLSAEFYAEQAKVVAAHIAKQDMVITTALVQGRKAPTLVTAGWSPR